MIYIRAYLKNNLGDDLFVRSLVRRYPDEKFYLCGAPKFLKAFRKEKNVIRINTIMYNWLRICRKLTKQNGNIINHLAERKARAVVHIGGSIFIETDNWRMDRKSIENDNIFIIGANYGPSYTTEFDNAISQELMCAKDCCFRDTVSYLHFKNIKSVRYAPDVLFGYKDFLNCNKTNGIGISVINLESRKNLSHWKNEYESVIKNVCVLCQIRNIPVTLFSFCEAEKDQIAIDRILEKIDSKKGIRVIRYTGDVDCFLNKFAECKYIIATRFHAMVLGWVMGKKVIPIIYSIKQMNILEDLKYQNYVWNLLEGEKAIADDLLKAFKSITNLPMIEKVKSDAELQFKVLDKFIKKSI
ncbi:polysaccharide pyruvyl transferase family protein [Lachnospiraceae bacterium DSM 108991]|uniref:Polysaccharide pyruvyl transferase family protein n=1 Tax=Claveliimonas monacensis TaxID=2779351 RepID=A0ABR9RKL6_9FIRM|nr:polysaccharide pyruvyl transferase family protein [Claveliimonas monacensis]MBE5063453.1 polysaccharide pyruvyl transferase family protein [Claveliimonas monacensis]